MKSLVIKPNPSGEYVVFMPLAVSGLIPVGNPFPKERIQSERSVLEREGFIVHVSDNKNFILAN